MKNLTIIIFILVTIFCFYLVINDETISDITNINIHSNYSVDADTNKDNIPKDWNYAKIINPDPCDLSGKREPDVVAEIGYGNREYYSLTNDYKQVTNVYASDIKLQTDEETGTNNRYCSDEAKVPGTEQANLDEGHIVADSLGGESNAYNITPQDSYQNRNGEQYKMEDKIRQDEENGIEVTDFKANITYPNTHTQIPSKYQYTFKENGKEKTIEFKNN